MKKSQRITALLIVDLILLIASSYMSRIVINDTTNFSYNLVVLVLVLLLSNTLCLTYRANPFYTSIFSAIRVSFSCCLAFIAFEGLHYALTQSFSKQIFVHALMFLPLAVFVRFLPRMYRRYQSSRSPHSQYVAIYGAGQTCYQVIQHMKSGQADIKIVGLIDDNPTLKGEYIDKYKIVGGHRQLENLKDSYPGLSVIIAIPSATGEEIQHIKKTIDSYVIPSKVVSRDPYYFSERSSRKIEIIDIDIESLIQRPLRTINYEAIEKDITGKSIMVTGGAGSIGSEIVRQIHSLGAKEIIVADFSELGLYKTSQYFTEKSNIRLELGDISDRSFTEHLFEKYDIDYIFHACAYKHVPLAETNVCNTIQNNIKSAKNIFQLAGSKNIKKVVLISSDKAVNPSNVMGATKRICEKLLIYYSRLYPSTIFSTVRFGNVLGSSGSVVPKFLEQIERNETLTVTHKDITRYFMSIAEASCLVLQASAECLSSRIYVLDMKEPIKLVSLAESLIRLAGKIPYEDIPIKFTGLRPGEKLYEELHLDHENSIKLNENYWELSQDIHLPKSFENEIEELLSLSIQYKSDLARDLLFKLLNDLRIVDHPSQEGISA